MIDGLTAGADRVTLQQWDALAKTIAEFINSDPNFYGVHFDLEPHTPAVYALLAGFKKYSNKPVTIAVANWFAEDFHYADAVALMAYDLDEDPIGFENKVSDRAVGFLEDARNEGGRAWLGVPAIAAHKEYEHTSLTQDGPVHRSHEGVKMNQYVAGSLRAAQAGLAPGPVEFLGPAVFALHERSGLHTGFDSEWFYPTLISEDVWSLLSDWMNPPP